MADPRITDEQAADALKQMLTARHGEQPVEEEAAPEEPVAAAPAEPAPVEEAPVVETVTAEESPAAEPPSEGDDVVSLRARLTEREAAVAKAEQQYAARLEAAQQRSQESERILRERYLRKSTVADRALKTLKAVRTEKGVPETEVDHVIQEIESSMNPASASYVPPTPQTEMAEDQSIALNNFLNEKQMDVNEAQAFGNWIKTDGGTVMHPSEQALAYRDLDGFLRIAHVRYQQAALMKETQRADAVKAVQTVQRAQKQVARAASATPSAPRKSTVTGTPPSTIDISKLTHDDISRLLVESVMQYK